MLSELCKLSSNISVNCFRSQEIKSKFFVTMDPSPTPNDEGYDTSTSSTDSGIGDPSFVNFSNQLFH